jgi:hypothetical protein
MGDAGEAQVQAAFDAHHSQGFVGQATDTTPNEAYTVAGVTSNASSSASEQPAVPAPEKAPKRRKEHR